MFVPYKLRLGATKISVGFHRQCGVDKFGTLICWGLHGPWDDKRKGKEVPDKNMQVDLNKSDDDDKEQDQEEENTEKEVYEKADLNVNEEGEQLLDSDQIIENNEQIMLKSVLD